MRAARTAAFLVLLGTLPARGQEVDARAMAAIREEGSTRSQVIALAQALTDRFGARVTNSSSFHAASDWAVTRLREWGVQDPRREHWGPWSRAGWTQELEFARVVSPSAFPLQVTGSAWSIGTHGRMRGQVVRMQLAGSQDLSPWRGRLAGRWVMLGPLAPSRLHFEPGATRLSADALAALEHPRARPREDASVWASESAMTVSDVVRSMVARCTAITEFLVRERAIGLLVPSTGQAGLVGAGGSSCASPFAESGSAPEYQPGKPTIPVLLLASEGAGRLDRLLASGTRVVVEGELGVTLVPPLGYSTNVVGEIPGRDTGKRGEVVMLGAHLDSWQVGTGATDNGVNVAVVLEAMRILRAVGLPMRRTVRVALWSGEEQGLLGSSAYVKAHFAPGSPEAGRLALYLNLDNGAGAIRGLYAQGNSAAGDIFRQWMVPLRDLGMTTVSPSRTGATDHVPFDRAGLPGFQFIQDPLEYWTLTHHTSADSWERAVPTDLVRNAIILASLAYDAANADEMIARPTASP
ncbi:MAG: hypothetical protein JWO05_3646 [Gemmatimonadetes bacterium]|nr:hypothetical protein [Gemmatimonadota bacterium]